LRLEGKATNLLSSAGGILLRKIFLYSSPRKQLLKIFYKSIAADILKEIQLGGLKLQLLLDCYN